MTEWEAVLLLGGGAAAGIVNTMAGGGSALTVPLLVLAGVPGSQANGSNRIGILAACLSAAATFRRAGLRTDGRALVVMVPAVVGSMIGSFVVSGLADETFERIFGFLLIPIIVLTVVKPKPSTTASPWSAPAVAAIFFLIGIYGGAFQAGVGLVLLVALTRAGYDLVAANNVKVLVNLAVTSIALPVYVVRGDVVWIPGSTLAVGFLAGGWIGARLAVRGGERIVRVFMVGAALYLAGELLGVW